MLTAGDEFGRTQEGNNNAYAQDNQTSWLDWEARDQALEAFVANLAAFRNSHRDAFGADFLHHANWRDLDGDPMTTAKWEDPATDGFQVTIPGGLTIRVDRRAQTVEICADETALP